MGQVVLLAFSACLSLGPWAAPAPAQIDRAVIGTWAMRTAEVEIRAEFKADGTYALAYRMPDSSEKQQGRYRAANGVLVLRPSDGSKGESLRYRLAAANVLEVVDEEGDGYRLVRQGAGAAQPTPQPQPQPQAE